jgi:prefoldin subunit 5
MTIDERLEALTMNLELLSRDVQDLKVVAQKDGENIRTLAGAAQTLHGSIQTLHDSIKMLENVVVSHDERLDDLEKH